MTRRPRRSSGWLVLSFLLCAACSNGTTARRVRVDPEARIAASEQTEREYASRSPSSAHHDDGVHQPPPPVKTTSTLPPPPPPPPLPLPPLDTDVLFDSNSAELKPEADGPLRAVATVLRERAPNARVAFIGHTDSQGRADNNQALSERRAEAVRQWFIGAGFPPDLLTARGVGESQPLEPDTDSRGRLIPTAAAANRRVEVVVDAGVGR